jgi:hypothetical protein
MSRQGNVDDSAGCEQAEITDRGGAYNEQGNCSSEAMPKYVTSWISARSRTFQNVLVNGRVRQCYDRRGCRVLTGDLPQYRRTRPFHIE